MKVIIAGSRTFNDYKLVCETMESLDIVIDEIVSGGATGADELGEIWAFGHHIPIKRFSAEWDKYGKAAGPIRNTKMGEYADFLVAFWDGKSRGTKNMIDYMKLHNKHGKVVIYGKENM